MGGSQSSDVHDWNSVSPVLQLAGRQFTLLDETLRDGVQSPSVVDPPVEDKLAIVHLMAKVGIGVVKAGMPSAGPRAAADALAVVTEIRDARLPLLAACAARTTVNDVAAVADIAQKTGVAVEVYTFIGSSPVRLYAEGWSVDDIVRHLERSTTFAHAQGLSSCLVTEDTTRSSPEVLEPLFRRAIDLGIRRLCLCDTAGHAMPDGVRALFAWTQALVRAIGVPVKLDYHGHNDRGMAVTNALTAIDCGADRVHGTALGIGERVGNAAIDQILINLALAGAWHHDLSQLVTYCQTVARACGVEIPANYPVSGRDAFRTATGVHAAAIVKAERRGDLDLADRVYSSVRARAFGLTQIIEIGHMSGLSNVGHWLARHGLDYDDELAREILACAKAARRVLSDDDVWAVVRERRVRLATK